MINFMQVVTTVQRKEDAEKIAEVVVGSRLVGCAQIIGPMRSVYWWKGNVERVEEWLCILKTRQDLYELLEQTIRQCHPYDVPEILALPVIAGNPNYLDWLNAELKKP